MALHAGISLPILALLAIGVVESRIVLGGCKSFPVMTGFQPEKFLGHWYEYSRYEFLPEFEGKCTFANYTDGTDDDGNFRVRVENISVNKLTGGLTSLYGYADLAYPDDPSKPGKLIVNFDNFPVHTETNYNVVMTDYDNYVIVYDCEKHVLGSSDVLWVLTRKFQPDPDMIEQIYQRLDESGVENFDTKDLHITGKDDCPM